MVPAKATPKAVAVKEQRRLITILKDDHNFDVVKFILREMEYIQKAKRIKPIEKRRLLKDYSLTLLSYCMPKMKIVEDDKGNKTPINFQINIGDGPAAPTAKGKPTKGGVSITIPTNKNKDGTYTV